MKIFIVYASAGSGHKKIAESINESAISLFGKSSVSLIDILDFSHPFFKLSYSNGYIFLISRLKWLWGFLFFLSNSLFLKFLNERSGHFIERLFCRRFMNFITKEQPDVIISTHFLVNELVSLLKGKGKIKTKLISMVTDFGVHNFWIAKNVDKYAVASNKTKSILISKRVSENKIKVLGIPARKQFQKNMDSMFIKQKFGLDDKRFTVLILTGGVGIGPIYQIVKLLNNHVNVVAICGNNAKLNKRLKTLNFKNLVVFGWIDYIEEAMKAADIVVTKPGGSTISECLTMSLPMIFFSIIPGQESQNASILSGYRLGLILKGPKEIAEKIVYFRDNPQEVAVIKNRIKLFRQHDRCQRVLNLINEK